MSPEINSSSVFKIASVFYPSFAMEKIRRRLVTWKVTAANIAYCLRDAGWAGPCSSVFSATNQQPCLGFQQQSRDTKRHKHLSRSTPILDHHATHDCGSIQLPSSRHVQTVLSTHRALRLQPVTTTALRTEICETQCVTKHLNSKGKTEKA